jgi:tetratricopeptide (TPR) repeat protein
MSIVPSRCVAVLVLAIGLWNAGCNRDPNYAKQQYLTSGNKYFARGRYKEAIIMYRKSLSKDPKFGMAYYRLAKTYEAMGQNANLVGVLRRATELLPPGSPEWNDAALKLGSIMVQVVISQASTARRKPLMDEIEKLEQVLQAKAPNSFENYRLQAEFARAEAAQAMQTQDINALKADLQKSMTYLRKSLEIKPNDVGTLLMLGRTLGLYGEHAEAEQIYRRLIDRDKTMAPPYLELYRLFTAERRTAEAEEILKRAISADPKDFGFRTLLASFYYEQKNRSAMTQVLEDLKTQFKDFPQAYFTAGDFYMRIRDYDMAAKQYQEGEQKDPAKKTEYQKREVDVLLRSGKSDDAYAKVLQMLKDNPNDADARAMKANFMLEHGQVEQAIKEFQSSLSQKSDSYVAHYNLGRAFAAKGDYEQAQLQYQESLKMRPDYLRPRLALAEVQIRLGDNDGALKTAQTVERMTDNNGAARLLEGVALMRQNKLADARKIFEDLTTKLPQFAEAHLELATLDLVEKKYPAAMDEFQHAAQDNPNDLRPLVGEARAWLAQKQPDKAVAVLEKELAANPKRADVLRELAGLKQEIGQYDSAMGDYRTLLANFQQNPRDVAQTYSAMGQVSVRKGDLKGALVWLQKAKELEPESVPLLIFTAGVYEKLSMNKEAQDTYRSVLAVDQGNAQALNNLAFSIANTGADLDEALTMAGKAKQRMPNSLDVSDTLGWIYVKKNMADQAVDLFKDLTAKAPDNPTYHYHYCAALVEKRDRAGAQRECSAALGLSPSQTEEDGAKRLLAQLR